MKKLYMIMIIIFSVMIYSNVNASTLSDFKQDGTFYTLTEINNGFYKNGAHVAWIKGTDFTFSGNSYKSDYDYLMFQLAINIVYADTSSTGQVGAPVNYNYGEIACQGVSAPSGTTGERFYYSCNLINQYHEREQISFTFKIFAYYNGGQTVRFCDYQNGYAICPQGNSNEELSHLEFHADISNSYYGIGLQLGNVLVFLKSKDQVQQNQFNEIMDSDTTQQGTNFESQMGNFDVPDDTGAFNMFGSLQSLLTNISISGACTRVQVPIPFVNQSVTLPCMTTDVYSVHFPQIVVLWQLIVRGLAYYYIIVNFIRLIKETIDPFSMKLEVLDL